MQDLETIRRLNAEAIEREIPNYRALGKYVVAEYAGLHFIGFETFSGPDAEEKAKNKLAELNRRGDSTSGKLFTPVAYGDTSTKLVDDSAA